MLTKSDQLTVKQHLISFIVPAYNEETELPITLRSIEKAAEDAHCDYEIVVVDDGSTDTTSTIARQFRAEVVSINRRQIAAARNAGAAKARGEVFIFVDADTHITSAHVLGVIRALNAGAVGGGARLRIDRQIPPWGKLLFHGFSTIYFGLQLGAGAFLFTSREKFLAIGGFDESYFASEEIFFTLALKKLGRFRVLPQPAITSGRKLRLHTRRQILTTLLLLMVGGRRAVMSRDKLSLWYGGARERRID